MNFRFKPINYRLIQAVLILIPIVIGIIGIGHDLPFVGNSIEEQSIAASFRLFIAPNFNEPCCLTYPPLYFYLTSGITWLVFKLGILFQLINDRETFIGQMLLDPTLLTIIFRILSIISYGGSAAFLYLATKNIFSSRDAVVAVLLFLSSPTLLRYATSGQSEIVLVLAGSILIYFYSRLNINKIRLTELAVVGLLCAVATSLKYNSAVLLLPFIFLIVVKRTRNFFQQLLTLAFFFISGNLLFHPYIPKIAFSRYFFDLIKINPTFALERIFPPGFFLFVDVLKEGSYATTIHKNIPLWLGKLMIERDLATGVLFITALILIIILIFLPRPKVWNGSQKIFVFGNLLVSLSLLIWVSTLRGFHGEYHYLLPIFPSLIILGSVFLGSIDSFTHRNFKIFVNLWLVASLLMVARNILTQVELLKPSALQLARNWIYDNSNPDEPVVQAPGTALNIINPKHYSFILPISSLPLESQKYIDNFLSIHPRPVEVHFRYLSELPVWPKVWDGARIAEISSKPVVASQFRTIFLTIEQMKQLRVRYFAVSQTELNTALGESAYPEGSAYDILFNREKEAFKSVINNQEVKLLNSFTSNRLDDASILVYQITSE